MIILHPENVSRVHLPVTRQPIPTFRIEDTRSSCLSPSPSAAVMRAMKGMAIVDVSPSGAIEFATAKAFSLLAKYFPAPSQLFPHRLPETLVQWLARNSQVEHPYAVAGLFDQGGEQLRVHISGREEGYFQLFLDERSDAQTAKRLTTLGLTPKEAEVLLWLSRGKTDGDIAAILGCRPRTVNKHTEQIRAKLGVETRTAAAVIAMEVMSLWHW